MMNSLADWMSPATAARAASLSRLRIAATAAACSPKVRPVRMRSGLVRMSRLRIGPTLSQSPAITSTFDQVHGADVFLVFVESYGAVADQPQFQARLTPARQRLEADIRDSHRHVASAYVESPTFGGSSWLAHISLLSGIEVKDPDTNALLMTTPRDTLVKAFRRGGYRTIGLMPGLRQQWPDKTAY